MKIALVVNPVAGQGRSMKVLPMVKRELGAHFELRTFKTRKRGDGLTLAREALRENCGAIVVLGGDGTIFEVANVVAKTSIKLGVIPSGTADVFAREMNIPCDPIKACQVIRAGRVRAIDVGKADDQFFLLMAGVGFDAQVVKDVNQDVKRMLKDLAYVLTGIKTVLTYKPSCMTICIDGRTAVDGYFVVVGNARYYAGRFSITKEASIEDGLLDVCVFKNGDIKSFARYITGVLLNKHAGFQDVELLRGRSVQIESEQPTFVQADGELIGKLPMSFTVIPKALSVFSPT